MDEQAIQDTDQNDRKLHQKLGDAVRMKSVDAVAKAQTTFVDATAHMPLYAVTPGAELIHRAAAVLLVIVFLFGLYRFENPTATPGSVAQGIHTAVVSQVASVSMAAQEAWTGLDLLESPEQVHAFIIVAHPSSPTIDVQTPAER
mgnify:FL=1|jgi:hypothetical protein